VVPEREATATQHGVALAGADRDVRAAGKAEETRCDARAEGGVGGHGRDGNEIDLVGAGEEQREGDGVVDVAADVRIE
jgi:hypothetical protein